MADEPFALSTVPSPLPAAERDYDAIYATVMESTRGRWFLDEYARRTRSGYAFGDNKGFIVNLPHRKSFSPDAAFYTGALTMRFLEGPPAFAVEVRSEGDYGPTAEQEIANKRADYFKAGTQVVWDVDLLSQDIVRVYRASDPAQPVVYRRGDTAEAEPAVPGWTMPVDDLFPNPIA